MCLLFGLSFSDHITTLRCSVLNVLGIFWHILLYMELCQLYKFFFVFFCAIDPNPPSPKMQLGVVEVALL